MASAGGGFGGGLGAIIGGIAADNHLDNALHDINDIKNSFAGTTEPYNNFGKSFLDPATSTIGGAVNKANTTLGYDQFMSSYTNTPAVQYQLDQADTRQNNTAAAGGKILSGENLRTLKTIDNGIISQGANTAYNEYLAGNSQQFGQLESSLGNMFSAIGIGQVATGQQAGIDSAQIGANTQLAMAQAKNDQSKGSGLGSMFSGISSFKF